MWISKRMFLAARPQRAPVVWWLHAVFQAHTVAKQNQAVCDSTITYSNAQQHATMRAAQRQDHANLMVMSASTQGQCAAN
jgi:hypothetical protein